MSLHEDDLLKRVYRRHFQTIADGNVGFVQAAPAGLISNKQAEKERSDERYALHVITKIRAPDSDVRKDYEALMAMSDSDLQKEADDRMFASKPGEPFPSRAHLRALAVGDARGVTDIWRQDRAPEQARVVKMEDAKQADSKMGDPKADSASRTAPLPKPKPLIPPRFVSPLRQMMTRYQNADAPAIPQQSRAVSR
ncbi:MAG: hypothetical protein ABF990_05220 [Acetobacter sp.]|jgi:hypothetical protein|uniref:hypothetical protein n=1 Tax=Acetobacter sp. TaxID=440 RepID=UPI0039EB9D21